VDSHRALPRASPTVPIEPAIPASSSSAVKATEVNWPIELAEYTAGTFRKACTRLGIVQSMGRVGSALDNAVIESWHSTVEFKLRQLEHFTTKVQARHRVASWIEEYNHDPRHSALGMRSPVQFELALQAAQQAQAA